MRLGAKRDMKRLAFLLLLGVAFLTCYLIGLATTTKRRRRGEPNNLEGSEVLRIEKHQLWSDPHFGHALVFPTGLQKFHPKNESGADLKVNSSDARPGKAGKPPARVGRARKKSRAIPRRRPPLPREQPQWDYLRVVNHGRAPKPRAVFSANETAAAQARRQEHLARVCRDVFKISPLDLGEEGSPAPWRSKTCGRILGTTYVNDDFEVTVSVIRKVGSSNWRRFMSSLFAVSSKEFRGRWEALRPLGRRPADDIRRDLRRNTKVLFVRNPLVRLLSGYRDKFVKLPTEFNILTARKIVRAIRGGKAGIAADPDPTFTEFLRYLLGPNGLRRDEHFAPIFDLSKPCLMRYDFIGKLETLPSDTDYLIERLGVKGRVEYGYPKPYSGSSNTTRLVEYFSQLPAELLQKVCQVYKDDFVAFGYPLPVNFSDIKTYMEKIT